MARCEQELRRILEDPDSDDPRIDYARDCLPPQDPRAELIKVQLRLARPEPDRSGTDAYLLALRERELLRQHQEFWGESIASLVEDYEFHRGFVELVRLTAWQFLDHAERLFSLAPILHLDLTAVLGAAEELFQCPYLRQIRSLSMNRCDLGDWEIETLAQSPHLQNLQWLSLAYNEIGRKGIEALAKASSLPLGDLEMCPLGGLVYVNLYGNRVDPTERYAEDQGIVTDTWLPPEGIELERKYGYLRWLHGEGEDARRRFSDRFELIDRLAQQQRKRRSVEAASVAAFGTNQAQLYR